MELRQINYFVAVAETKSLKNAIDRVHVAQPALSHSIKLLEEDLGVDLFVRSRSGMELTGAGKKFLVSAKLILQEVSRAKERVSEEENDPSGTVNMALLPSVSSVLSVPLFRAVNSRYPNIILNIEEQTRIDVHQVFDAGDLDLLVYTHVDDVEHVGMQPLIDEWLYLITQPDSESRLAEEIEFSCLRDYPLLFPRVINSAPRNVEALAKRLNVDVSIMSNHVPPSNVVELVRQGVANSVVPWTLVHAAVAAREIAAAKLVEPEVKRRISLIHSENRYLSNAAIAVMALIKQLTIELNAKGVWRGTLLVGG